MLRTIRWKKFDAYEEGWLNPKHTFDSFEPDYDPQIARPIGAGETQEHNFHQQFNFPGSTQCDVDWVRYTPAQSGPTTISTAAITGRTAANTRLTLFDVNQTQLAQNDDISSTNQFSAININLQAGQTYFIRVENMSGGVTGYYNLRVCAGADLSGLQISGDNSVCGQSTYTIPGLPSGAAVNWSVSPQGLVSLSTTTGPQTTLTRINGGTITLTATIVSCGVPWDITKAIDVVDFNDAYLSTSGNSILISHPSSWNVNAYRWYRNGVFFRQTTAPQINTTSASQCYDWSVSFLTPCDWSPETLPQSIGCGFRTSTVAYPNPVKGDKLNIQMPSDGEQRTILLQDKEAKVWRTVQTAKLFETLDVSSVPAGTYYLSIRTGKQKESYQIIIEKN